MKKILAIVLICSALVVVYSQNNKPKGAFAEFKEQINKDFKDTKARNDSSFRAFRAKINARYAEFLKENWVDAEAQPAIPAPKEDKPVPPMPYIEPAPVDTIPVPPTPIEEDTTTQPKVEPIAPIAPIPAPAPEPTPIVPEPVIDTVTVPVIVPPVDTIPVEPTPIEEDTVIIKDDSTTEIPPVEVVPPAPKPNPILNTVPLPTPRLIPFDVVITPPDPEKQPMPVVPIYEIPQTDEEWFEFTFYGTECKVRLDSRHKFTLSSIDGNALSEQWKKCTPELYDNLIRDCLTLRVELKLCDYAYLQMLETLCNAFYGKDTNEAVFLMAYLYCQSGYKMRFAITSTKKLRLMYSTKHTIFNRPYYTLNDGRFYPYNIEGESCSVCPISFENEQAMSLILTTSPEFESVSEERLIQSSRYTDMQVKVGINKNLIDFYESYPSSEYSGNFMTQWAIYANTPMSEDTKDKLYPYLKNYLKGLSQFDAVSRLLNLIQTGLEYEFDEVVWGRERALFAEESLYYPYCDCEDRSILLSRLIRDLVGLDVVLVYYPGHLAMAVNFTDNVRGDYLEFEGKKYIICDPTYIGAPVGMSMPGMDNSSAKLIKLKRD